MKINYYHIENRIKQGIAAGAGTFAMTSVTAFRIGHERGIPLPPGAVFKFSAIVSAISAVVWALMPNAKEDPAETLEHAKKQFYPALKVGINRILDNEQLLRDTLTHRPESKGLTYRKPSYTYTSSDDRQRSIDRLNNRYHFSSGFEDDADVPDEQDFYTDEEYEEILREELLSDPTYEGPSSVFDRY